MAKAESKLLASDKQGLKLLLLSFIVGIGAGISGTLFRWILSKIEDVRQLYLDQTHPHDWSRWLILAGILIIAIGVAIFLVRRFAPEASGSGIQEIEGALDDLRPMRWKRVIPIKFISSILSLGSGLLLGREGPTIQLGANIGKMVKDLGKQPDEQNNPLISTGASAGLASAFNAPLSGIIFVIEEMNEHFRFNFYSVASIMIGAGTADCIVRFFLGDAPALAMKIFSFQDMNWIWLFALLGIVLSVVGWLFNKFVVKCLDYFRSTKISIVWVVIFLGVMVCFLGYLSPDLIGSGYDTIYWVLKQSYSLKFLLILLAIRFVFTIISYGSGAPGGIFTPLLTIGVLTGMLFGFSIKMLLPGFAEDPTIFAVAGMAGIFASTVRAPITGVMLLIEMTSNYQLILPLILTTLFASAVTTMLGNRPIYTILLERTLNEAKMAKEPNRLGLNELNNQK